VLSSYVILAHHPRRPLASFLGVVPISHSSSALLLPTDHCPLLTIELSPLDATLMDISASVANKRLTARLSPSNATLTKKQGGGYSRRSCCSPKSLPHNSFADPHRLNPYATIFYKKGGGGRGLPDAPLPPIVLLPFSVHSSMFRIPQPLYLPLLRKHPGCGGILPILERADAPLASRMGLRDV
jgi:hypothetical protein